MSLKNKIQSFFAAAEKDGAQVTIHGRSNGLKQLGNFAKVVIVSMSIVAAAAGMKVSFDNETSKASDFEAFSKMSLNIPSPDSFAPGQFANAPEVQRNYKASLEKIDKQSSLERGLSEDRTKAVLEDNAIINQMMASVDVIKAQLDETCDFQPATVNESAKVSCNYSGAERGETVDANSIVFKVGELQGFPIYIANASDQGFGAFASQNGDEQVKSIFIDKDLIGEIQKVSDPEMREQVTKFTLDMSVVMADLYSDKDEVDASLVIETAADHLFEQGYSAREISDIAKTTLSAHKSFFTKAWNLKAADEAALSEGVDSLQSKLSEVMRGRELASSEMKPADFGFASAEMGDGTWVAPVMMNLETGKVTYPVAKDSRMYTTYQGGSSNAEEINSIRNSLQSMGLESEDGTPVYTASYEKNGKAGNGFGVITNINADGEKEQPAIFLDKDLVDAINQQDSMRAVIMQFTVDRASMLKNMPSNEMAMSSSDLVEYSSNADLQVIDNMMNDGLGADEVYEIARATYVAETAFISKTVGMGIPESGLSNLLEHKLKLVDELISQREAMNQISRETYQVGSFGGD